MIHHNLKSIPKIKFSKLIEIIEKAEHIYVCKINYSIKSKVMNSYHILIFYNNFILNAFLERGGSVSVSVRVRSNFYTKNGNKIVDSYFISMGRVERRCARLCLEDRFKLNIHELF